MTDITIYDPAMCCSSGVCGAEVDQQLVAFAADLDWLTSQGVTVRRINLSQEPAEFAGHAGVAAILGSTGVAGLPVILVADTIACSGRYPGRAELAGFAGIDGAVVAEAPKTGGGCGCSGDSADKTSSSCC